MKKLWLFFFVLIPFFINKECLSSPTSADANIEDSLDVNQTNTQDIKKKRNLNPSSFFKKIIPFTLVFMLLLSLLAPSLAIPLASGTGLIFNPQFYSEDPSWFIEPQSQYLDVSNDINSTLSGFDIPQLEDPQAQPQFFEPLNIFGSDNRVDGDSSAFPISAIGRVTYQISNGQSYSCTGEMVSRSHMLTNAHCVFEDIKNDQGQVIERQVSDRWKRTFRFHPAFSDGISKDEASWRYISYHNAYKDLASNQNEQDWAIIHLTKAFGDYFGQMTLRDYRYSDLVNFQTPINLVGYSGDHYMDTVGAHFNCETRGIVHYSFGYQIIHDCDSTKGSSGSALYFMTNEDGSSHANIMGIHHAAMVPIRNQQHYPTFSSSTANLACETHEAYFALQHALNQTDPNPYYDGPPEDHRRTYILLGTLGGGAALLIIGYCVFKLKPCKKKHDEEKTPRISARENTQLDELDLEEGNGAIHEVEL